MTDRRIDPVISEYVANVANRFGVTGLEDLIALATEELDLARSALEGLGRVDE